jgi:hypothetical protein
MSCRGAIRFKVAVSGARRKKHQEGGFDVRSCGLLFEPAVIAAADVAGRGLSAWEREGEEGDFHRVWVRTEVVLDAWPGEQTVGSGEGRG